jgi:ankyrin repeat protein
LDGWTLLHHAVTKKFRKIVEVLIKYGCNVNKQTESMKSTSLHLAVMEK